MGEYVKLTSNKLCGNGTIFVKARQVSSICERVHSGKDANYVQVSMMGGSYYQVTESFDQVKKLLGIETDE